MGSTISIISTRHKGFNHLQETISHQCLRHEALPSSKQPSLSKHQQDQWAPPSSAKAPKPLSPSYNITATISMCIKWTNHHRGSTISSRSSWDNNMTIISNWGSNHRTVTTARVTLLDTTPTLRGGVNQCVDTYTNFSYFSQQSFTTSAYMLMI